MKFLCHIFCFLVVWAALALNINTMLFKAADLFRGDLIGSDLEYALLKITVVPAAAFITFGYMYYLVLRSYNTHVLKECTKCKCKSCSKRLSSIG